MGRRAILLLFGVAVLCGSALPRVAYGQEREELQFSNWHWLDHPSSASVAATSVIIKLRCGWG